MEKKLVTGLAIGMQETMGKFGTARSGIRSRFLGRVAFWAGVAALAVSLPMNAQAATVNISGTQSGASVDPTNGNYRPYKIDTGVLFDPLSGPVTVTGSVDISSLLNNSSVYVGLISKIDYDEWLAANIPGANDPKNFTNGFFGFIDTAYGAFNTLNGGRLVLGQQTSFSNTTQGNTVAKFLGTTISGFTLTFGDHNFSGTTGGPAVTQTYQNGFDYVDWYHHPSVGAANNIGHPQPTDWTKGAYAFVGTFFDKNVDPVGPLPNAGCNLSGTCAPVINVNFSGPLSPVPEPETYAMMLAGLGLMGFIARRRKQNGAAA